MKGILYVYLTSIYTKLRICIWNSWYQKKKKKKKKKWLRYRTALWARRYSRNNTDFFYYFTDCGAPAPITGVAITTGDTIQGSRLVLQCAIGYQPNNAGVSSDSIRCQVTGTWTEFSAVFKCLKGKNLIFHSYQRNTRISSQNKNAISQESRNIYLLGK